MKRAFDHKLIEHEVVRKVLNVDPDDIQLSRYPESPGIEHISAGQDVPAAMSPDEIDSQLLNSMSNNAGLVPPESQSSSKRAPFLRAGSV